MPFSSHPRLDALIRSVGNPKTQRRWQVGVNSALLLCAAAMWLWVTWRAIYLIVMVPVAIVPFSYARLRLHACLARRLSPTGRPLLVFGLAGMICDAIMVGQILTSRAGSPLPVLHDPAVGWVGAVWYSAFGLLFFGFLGLSLCRVLVRGVRFVIRQPVSSRLPAARPMSPARREFLARVGLAGAGAPLVFSVSSIPLTYDFQVGERDVALPGWPAALDGLRVAHLSDIHVGGAMDRAKLLRVADLTAQAKPDLVLHTGDFLTHRTGDFARPLYEALARIRAPYGQWACLGNHDFDAPDRLVRLLDEAGVVTLRNRVATVQVAGQPVELAGIDFLFRRVERAPLYRRIVSAWGARTPISGPPVPRLLLNHDPRGFAALPAGCADLVLSGHTHGGHVGIQLGKDSALSVVGLLGIPDQGLYRRGDMHMFVTRCVGFYGYPMRLGIPPEISLLTLRSAPRTEAGRSVDSPGARS